jgi:hypothetical protein
MTDICARKTSTPSYFALSLFYVQLDRDSAHEHNGHEIYRPTAKDRNVRVSIGKAGVVGRLLDRE